MKLAPCGIDCDACQLKPEQCDGCHAESNHLWCSDCNIRVCCIFKHKLDNCSQCNDFPCKNTTDFENDHYVHHTHAVTKLREMYLKNQ